MYENSDEYDFTPSDSSKLASLFGNSMSINDVKGSLTYTAPKQPRIQERKKEEKNSNSQTTALLAKIVILWKLENNKDYKPLGKCVLALIGSKVLNVYELIMYKEKNNILARTRLNDKLTFYNCKDNFSSFYDGEYQNWLVKFESNDRQEFIDKIIYYGVKVVDKTENSTSKPDLLPKPLVSPENVEEHSDSSGCQKRAKILDRMAKMGQQILPNALKKGISSDSEEDYPESSDSTQPRKYKKGSLIVQKYQEKQVVGTTPNYVQPMMPIHDGVSQYLIAQNTDLKINLAQISAKLDNVLSSNNNHQHAQNENILQSKLKALELKCENLQTALDNSQRYVTEIEDKDKRIKALEAEIEKIKQVKIVECNRLLSEHEDLKNVIKDQGNTIEIQKIKLEEDFQEQNKYKEHQEELIKELEATVSNLRLKLNDFEAYHERTLEENQTRVSKDNEKFVKLNNVVKYQMNAMYQDILGNLDEDSSYSYEEVKTTIARQLKKVSFKIIEDCKNIIF